MFRRPNRSVFSVAATPLASLFLVTAACGGGTEQTEATKAAAAQTGETELATVSGTILYLQRIALPHGAVLTVKLEDVSLADAPSKVLAEAAYRDIGAPPYAFELQYHTSEIIDTNTYAVSARITEGERLWFVSDTHKPVITGGAGDNVEIILKMARGPNQKSSSNEGATKPPAHGLSLPASFTGTLPCADCDGIQHHLDLWDDQVYHLTREWLGKDKPLKEAESGRWRIDPARRAVILYGAREKPHQLEIKERDTLRLLDQQGMPIDSDLPYNLKSEGALTPAPLKATFFVGEMRYTADAAVYKDCLTERRYPIALEAAFRHLEAAYTENISEAGGWLRVNFEGDLVSRPKTDGVGDEATIIVSRVGSVQPDTACHVNQVEAPAFVNTFWIFTDIGVGDPSLTAAAPREPYMLFLKSENGLRFSANVGCNNFSGSVEQVGGALQFAPNTISTMMGCTDPLQAAENRLTEVIQLTRSYTIDETQMLLVGENGDTLATLTAKYF